MNEDQCLQEFRQLLAKSNENKLDNESDQLLLQFVRSSDHCVQRAVNQLLHYKKTKQANPNLFLFSTELKKVFESEAITISEQRTSNGELVLISRPGRWNPSLYSFRNLMQASCVAMLMEISDERTQNNGIVNIVDCSGFGLRHLLHFGPSQAKLFADLIDKILPVKYNSIHLVNESKFAKFAFRLIKSFLSVHLGDKLHFHGNQFEQLHSFVASSALPTDFGGQCNTYNGLIYYERIRNHYV